MRIALVSLHTSPGSVPGSGDAGGMNVVIAEAARALSARGHEVWCFTRATADAPPGEGPLTPRDAEGARLVAIPAGPAGLRKGELPPVVPEFSDGLRRFGRFDAVHAHYWLSGIAALPLAAASEVTPVLTMHTVAAQKNANLAPGDRPEPGERIAGERALARRSFIVAGSQSELAAVTAGYGTPPHGSEVIQPGVDVELFRPGSLAPDDVSRETTAAPLRITVLGRVQPLKGQELAVEAAAEIARRDPALWERCEVVIAGEPTPGAEPYAAELRARAERLGIAKRVRFLPSQDRVATSRLLASSAVVLVPSHSETFGLVALEAAACGVPSIVGAHSGLVEAAPAGKTAVHVRGRDPRDWAEAIRALLTDEPRRRELAARAREHALTHDWAAHAERLERVYSRLARG